VAVVRHGHLASRPDCRQLQTGEAGDLLVPEPVPRRPQRRVVLDVARRRRNLLEARVSLTPQHSAESLVESLDRPVAVGEPGPKGREARRSVVRRESELVVDLPGDHVRLVRNGCRQAACDEGALHAVDAVRVVAIPSSAVGHVHPILVHPVYPGILGAEPGRRRRRRRPEDHVNAFGRQSVDHPRQPRKFELAFLGFHQRPRKLAHPDDIHAHLRHQSQVFLDCRLIPHFWIVRRPVVDLLLSDVPRRR